MCFNTFASKQAHFTHSYHHDDALNLLKEKI